MSNPLSVYTTVCALVLLQNVPIARSASTTNPPFQSDILDRCNANFNQGVQQIIQQTSSILDRQDASDRQISKLIQRQDELQQQFAQLLQQQQTIQHHVSELLASQNNNQREVTTLLHLQREQLDHHTEQLETLSEAILKGTPSHQTAGSNNLELALAPEILGIKKDLSNVLVRTISLQSLILRLENGRSHSEGRVEVYYNGEWGALCGKNWTDAYASVVCRQLGLPHENAEAKTHKYFGGGSGRFHFKDVICNGNENSLWSCRRDKADNCRSSEAVAVVCHSIRLTNGSDANEGRIEVWHGGEWKAVCGRDWDDNDAKVVCRQLHLPYEGAIASDADYFGRSTGTLMLTGYNCEGSEKNLLMCDHQEADMQETCNHAGVVCQQPIRLVDGQNDYEGVVEMWYDNEWGKICGLNWDTQDAMVACRHLNLPAESAVVRPSFYFRRLTTYEYIISDVECRGDELTLAACNHGGWGWTQCYNSHFAAISCPPIRLVNGTTKYNGRVEIWQNDQWGSICDNNFGVKEAQVVCQNLEMSYENSTLPEPAAFFGEGNGPIWFHHVNCTGSESNITECDRSELGIEDCNDNRDPGVICGPQVRLQGGIGYHQGRVEVWHEGEWGTVCQTNFGDQDAAVLCRELGLPYHYPEVVYSSYFGEGSGRIWIDQLDCKGHEKSLRSCDQIGWGRISSRCDHSIDAGVKCKLPIRLVNGSNTFEGRVEIWNNEKEAWGTVCDSHWGRNNAKVVCRQLGLSYDNVEIKTGAYFGKGSGPVWLHDVNCTGAETTLWSCEERIDGINTCDHSRDVGVVCKPPIRFVGGANKYEGRVQLWNDDSGWGYVCGDSWNREAAIVACRQLLLPFADPKSGTEFIFVDSISDSEQTRYQLTECRGVEESVLSCRNNGWRIGQCTSGIANISCDGPLMLVDYGSGANFFKVGRVLIWNGAVSAWGTVSGWGTVSSYGWDDADARVVCRELGFTDSAQTLLADADGGGSQYYDTHEPVPEPVWMNNVGCNGTEDSIWSCPHDVGDVLPDFSSRYVAGVKCESYSNRVRFLSGENARKGIIEVQIVQRSRYDDHSWSSTWGVVCKQNWGDKDAKVACRELGLPFENAKARKMDREDNKPSLIDNVQCTGLETSLLLCPHVRSDPNCSRLAAVVCE